LGFGADLMTSSLGVRFSRAIMLLILHLVQEA
jgi:hypothetical protein